MGIVIYGIVKNWSQPFPSRALILSHLSYWVTHTEIFVFAFQSLWFVSSMSLVSKLYDIFL